jgi:hypothetical protein
VTGRRIRHGLGGQTSPWLIDGDGGDVGEPSVYSPSRHDPVARAASVVIGGPAGRRLASATGFWRAVPVLMLLACAVLSLGVVQKQHCRAQGWSSPDQFWHACYSDIPVLYGSAGLGSSTRPGLVQSLGQGGLGQPPLAGALMWVTSSFVPSTDPSAGREFFDLSAVLLALGLAIAVGAVALTLAGRSWDAAHLALSPVLITAGLISYELLAVTLTAVALLALARGRPVSGGVLLGLAVASAPQVAVVGFVVAILAGRYLRSSVGLAFGGSALACWLALRVLLLPGLAGGLGSAWSLWRGAVPGYGSIWLVPQLLGASQPQPATSWIGRALQLVFGWIFHVRSLDGTTASVLALVLLIVLAVAVLWITVISEPVPAEPLPAISVGEFVTRRVAPLSLTLLAVVLLTAKSLPVQASLLLLPLIALSGLRWRDHLIWAATELVYFVGIWLYIAGESKPSRGLPASFYLVLVVARLAGIAWVGWQGLEVFRAAPSIAGMHEPGCGQTRDEACTCGQISSQVVDAGRLLDDRSAELPHHSG